MFFSINFLKFLSQKTRSTTVIYHAVSSKFAATHQNHQPKSNTFFQIKSFLSNHKNNKSDFIEFEGAL